MGWVVNILDQEISNSPHICASQELKVGVNSLAGFSKNNIHEWDYITNPTRFWLIKCLELQLIEVPTFDQLPKLVIKVQLLFTSHTYGRNEIQFIKQKPKWLNGMLLHEWSSSSLGTFWPQSLEFSTEFRTQYIGGSSIKLPPTFDLGRKSSF